MWYSSFPWPRVGRSPWPRRRCAPPAHRPPLEARLRGEHVEQSRKTCPPGARCSRLPRPSPKAHRPDARGEPHAIGPPRRGVTRRAPKVLRPADDAQRPRPYVRHSSSRSHTTLMRSPPLPEGSGHLAYAPPTALARRPPGPCRRKRCTRAGAARGSTFCPSSKAGNTSLKICSSRSLRACLGFSLASRR